MSSVGRPMTLMLEIDMALLTECESVFVMSYKHVTPDGVETTCADLQLANQFVAGDAGPLSLNQTCSIKLK